MQLWRISLYPVLDGRGGLQHAGRWHTAGRPVVYLAENPAGCLLEILVHLDLDARELPAGYTLLTVGTSGRTRVEELLPPPGRAWVDDLRLSRRLGDEWLEGGRTALARVPSAIVPRTWNYLLNPLHADAGLVKIVGRDALEWDERLLRSGA